MAVTGRSELDRFGQRILDLEAVHTAGTPRQLSRAGEIICRQMISDATIGGRLGP